MKIFRKNLLVFELRGKILPKFDQCKDFGLIWEIQFFCLEKIDLFRILWNFSKKMLDIKVQNLQNAENLFMKMQ